MYLKIILQIVFKKRKMTIIIQRFNKKETCKNHRIKFKSLEKYDLELRICSN